MGYNTIPHQQGRLMGCVRTDVQGRSRLTMGGIELPGSIFIHNVYNRVSWVAGVGDSNTSWAYSTATWRAARGVNTMRVSFVVSVNEGSIEGVYWGFSTTTGSGGRLGAAYDNTIFVPNGNSHVQSPGGNALMPGGIHITPPGIGFHFVQAIERGATGVTFYGTTVTLGADQSMIVVTGDY